MREKCGSREKEHLKREKEQFRAWGNEEMKSHALYLKTRAKMTVLPRICHGCLVGHIGGRRPPLVAGKCSEVSLGVLMLLCVFGLQELKGLFIVWFRMSLWKLETMFLVRDVRRLSTWTRCIL